MALSQKHYVAIAEIISEEEEHDYAYSKDACNKIARKLADFFAKNDPQFDQVRFLSVCNSIPLADLQRGFKALSKATKGG